jgi:hypothetical protein
MALRTLAILSGARNLTFVARLVGFGLAALIAAPLLAQQQTAGFPEDWSHHHLTFSNPGTLQDAVNRGSVDGWYKVVSDPRFAFQQLKRGAAPAAAQQATASAKKNPKGTDIKRDWSATLGGAGVAPDMYPAKWQFSTSGAPSCSDYVVFGVNKAGISGSQPNIVGYQNLYVNAGGTGACSGTAPTVLFSYFVGTGTVQTSPVLGPSANQLAYVESITGNGTTAGSKFHVLKGAGTGSSNGTIGAPVAPGSGNSASDAALTISGFVSVTRSAPFYDYLHDIAYVGDDTGKLHKFTPVFSGTPAEVTSTGANVWPAVVSTQTSPMLTAPIYDSVSQKVWVGDATGYLYAVNSTTGSGTSGVTASGQLGLGTGIVEAPLVDSSAETVYVFLGENKAATASAVVAFSISSFGSGGTGTSSATVGTYSATIPLYLGTFDNTYYTSSNSAQPAGNLYVCGNAGGDPTLYRIPITYSSGLKLGTVVTGPVLASTNVGCSPLTEFYNTNTSTDWLFAGVSTNSCGADASSTQGGCVMSFNITSTSPITPTVGPWTPSTSFAASTQIVDTAGNLQECTSGCGDTGGTSGATTPPWATSGTTNDGITNASAVGTVSSNGAMGNQTVTIGGLTLTASAPVAEVATISVPTSTYCIAPGAGFTVGTGPTNITTNGTAPSGGSIDIGSDSGLSGMSVTIGGVTYNWESSLTVTGCGTSLNCLIRGGLGSGHEVSAEALYRAVNNSGNCTDNSFDAQCYVLATGQGANAAATASHTADSTTTSISAWKCAGTAASLWSVSGCSGETCTSPTGGSAGTSPNIIMPATMSNTSLASAINTALGSTAGFTHNVNSSTVTLTASAAGSTGFTAELDGSVTGVNVAVTTSGSNGNSTAPNFTYWNGASAVSTAQLASNIAAAAAGNSDNVALSYTSPNAFFTATGTGSNAGAAGNTVGVGGTLADFAWTYNASSTTALKGGQGLVWTYQSASNGQTTAAQATGTSGIIIDNVGSSTSTVANIYFGTLSGNGATNSGVKMTQSGLQ